ncbi:hypothetical protein Droror1_Dr00001956 [Drosera rotundifolia]
MASSPHRGSSRLWVTHEKRSTWKLLVEVRCKRVCKQWHDWITSHGFANDHLASKSSSQQSILLRQRWESNYDHVTWDLEDVELNYQPQVRKLNLDFLSSGGTVECDFFIESSCNGLLLVHTAPRFRWKLQEKIGSVLPLTHPKPRDTLRWGLWRSWLIGYDSGAKRYHVAMMRTCREQLRSQVVVFSCTGKYSRDDVADGAWRIVHYKGIFLPARGKLIWVMFSYKSSNWPNHASCEPCLLWYDM